MKPQFSLLAAALLVAGAVGTSAAGAATLPPDQQAVHVLNRLAFGPKPGDIERVNQMGVQRYIESQLNPETIAYPAALANRLKSNETLNRPAGDIFAEYQVLQRQVKDEDEGAKQKRRAQIAKIAFETSEARMVRAVDSPRQLEEVMVDFWFNHFNVYAGKGIDRALIASYERDAIRPYALGSFRQMLGATAKHPAMLYYLDNYLSTSSDYSPGLKGKLAARLAPNAPKTKARGLNENFAREVMELHTLGVDTGYTQHDVTELARMLTGWTYEPRAMARTGQTFTFDPARHDNGTKHWLGREITPNGVGEGEYALDVLAMHPATAHHLSFELAQYFVSDTPPPALVERMAKTYLDSKGEIRAVLRTLFASDEFMSADARGAKFKTPYQFVVSAARASATPLVNVQPLLATMTQLGMPLYGCQTPDGYKNTQDAWLNPDALSRRITFATALAGGRLPLATAAPIARNGAQAQAKALAASDKATNAMAGQMQAAMDAAPESMAAAPNALAANADGAAMPPAGKRAARAAAAAAAAAPGIELDPALLTATLGATISARTSAAVAANPVPLRAAMLLGSPDFMQR